jgi:hypothetical protein
MIAWRIQERFYGGHDKATIKLLNGLARGEAAKLDAGPRRKPGSRIIASNPAVGQTRFLQFGGSNPLAPASHRGSLAHVFRYLEKCRYFRGLAPEGTLSGEENPAFPTEGRILSDESLLSEFSIFRNWTTRDARDRLRLAETGCNVSASCF